MSGNFNKSSLEQISAASVPKSHTSRMTESVWAKWDELERLLDRSKRLSLKISVLDPNCEEVKSLKSQKAQNFARIRELVSILGAM